MNSNCIFLSFGFILITASLAGAQPFRVTASTPTTTSLYAQERISLMPGFQAVTGGFEAKIKFPESVGGRLPIFGLTINATSTRLRPQASTVPT